MLRDRTLVAFGLRIASGRSVSADTLEVGVFLAAKFCLSLEMFSSQRCCFLRVIGFYDFPILGRSL